MNVLDVYAYNLSCLFTTLKDSSVTKVGYNCDKVLVIKLNFPNFIVTI